MNTTLKYLSAFALSLGLAACSSSSSDPDPMPPVTPPPADPVTVFDVADGDDRFSILVTALQTAGLETTLRDPESEFTVFAPTNEAFENLLDVLETDVQGLLANPDLSEILLYHVLRGSVDAAAAFDVADSDESTVPTANANGDPIALSRAGESGLLVNLSTVIQADVTADNGVIHALDTVLLPPAARGEPTLNIVETAREADGFDILVLALETTGLDADLSTDGEFFTVFAPTDEAFGALGENNIASLLEFPEVLAEILTQHVMSGEVNSINAYASNGSNVPTLGGDFGISIADGKLYFGGAEVEVVDIYTTNGIIHVIDTVVVGDVQLPKPAESIVGVAQAVESEFTVLEKALLETGLASDLSDLDRNFTVFAPTDAAFEAFLAEEGLTEEELLADPSLADVLLYHVIEGPDVLASAAVSVAQSDESLVPMLGGGQVALSYNNETLYINLSSVIDPNVMAANGVIHVIDKVLMPPAEMGEPVNNIVQTAINAEVFGTLVDFLMQTGLDEVLANEEATFTVFAPTDNAFEMLGGAADNLTTEQLRQVLLHHVISGDEAVDSINAFSLNGATVPTEGDDLTVFLQIVDGMLQVEGSNIVMYDIYTTNGIIHVIDAVITSSLGE